MLELAFGSTGGPGDVEYKQRFGTSTWREARADLFSRTRRGWLLRGYKAAGDWLSWSIHPLAARLSMLNRIKQAWRRRLAGE